VLAFNVVFLLCRLSFYGQLLEHRVALLSCLWLSVQCYCCCFCILCANKRLWWWL